MSMRQIRWYIIPFCLFLVGIAYGQPGSILNLPDSIQLFAFTEWRDTLMKGDRDAVKKNLEGAYRLFEEKNEMALQKMAFLYLILDRVYAEPAPDPGIVLDSSIAITRRKKWHDLTRELELLKAEGEFARTQSIPALETIMGKVAECEKLGWSSPVNRRNALVSLGHYCYKFADYELSVNLVRKALKIKMPEALKDFGHMNILGLAYLKMQKYDSAIHYFKEALHLAQLRNDTAWAGVIMGNIGNVYYKKGDYENALPYLEADFNTSVKHQIIGSAVNASSILANIELHHNNIAKAEEYIHYAATRIDTSDIQSMMIYLGNLFTYSKLNGKYREAVEYADRLQHYKVRHEKVFNNEMFEKTNMRVRLAQYSRDVQLLQASKSKQVLLRNALFVIFLLTGIIALLLVKRIENIRKHSKEKLDKAQAELNWFTKSLIEKNELIQTFREKEEYARRELNDLMPDRSHNISELTHASILTEEHWKHFRILFDEVYPGFLVRLREKFNDLTPAEIRLMALTKLHIAPKDMAEMLGISPDSIKKTRYRLRKKINLPEEGTLEELVTLI